MNMPNNSKRFGTNLQFFIKHVLENKCDDVTFVDNILTTDKIKNLINKWNEVTKSNIPYESLIRNFCNYNIKCIQKKSKFSYQFPPNFKLNEIFTRTKITVYKKNNKKLEFIKTLPIGIFQMLKGKGGLDYSGFIKTVKLTTEEECIINNTEIIFNLYDNGLIH
jgi:hypothetical protein